MNRKTTTAALASAAVVLGGAVFAVTFVRAGFYNPSSPAPLPTPVTHDERPPAPGAYPARIRMSRIGIDAAVENVGNDAQGRIGVPARFSQAGWYAFSAVPGTRGNAIIVGHLDNGFGYDGAFKRLSETNIGDAIEITTASGTPTHFTIYDKQSFAFDQVPAETFWDRSDDAYLTLVTCGGRWLLGSGTYSDRLIVYARRGG